MSLLFCSSGSDQSRNASSHPAQETGVQVMASRGGASRPNGPNAGNKICQFKLVLLGESAVGKSSLVLRFVKGQFHEFQESTIGGMLTASFVFFLIAPGCHSFLFFIEFFIHPSIQQGLYWSDLVIELIVKSFFF